MTLQEDWDEEASASTVTTILGYDENEDPRRSAIPLFLDDWFHGDFTTDRPTDQEEALGEKSLDEYAEEFAAYRIHSAVEIGFDTDGETIDDYEVQTTDPEDDDTTGGLSPVTLEGDTDDSENPFRNEFDDYDDDENDDYLPAVQKGPYTATNTDFQVETEDETLIDGVRVSLIFGGSDRYLEKVKEDEVDLAELVNYNIPWFLTMYFSHLPAFYTFIDFAFMADGAKAVRVWDASRYPAHALYVDGQKERQNTFREGSEWTTNRPAWKNRAFIEFAIDGQVSGATPFN